MSLRIFASALLSSALLLPATGFCAPRAPQLFSNSGKPLHPPAADTPEKQLNDLFAEIWQDRLSHNPEFASIIGDKRWNDELSDYSVNAYNQQIGRYRGYLIRLGSIGTTGFPAQEVLSRDLMADWLVNQIEASQYKPWEMPVNQFSGLQVSLPQLVSRLSFTSAKDYDDYIARLQMVPTAFRQISDDCLLGIDDHRVPPKYLLEKVLVQVNTLLAQKPEDSPFARPLQHFPASVSAADQTRIHDALLTAIKTSVYAAYQRFAKFLQAEYIPAGRTDPGLWSLPDGAAYYAFLVKQSTTTDLAPDQIHQIGLEQLQKDEAAELTLAKKLGFSTVAALRAAVAANPKLHPASAEALLDLYRSDIGRNRAKLPDLFTHLPTLPLTVQAVPAYIAKDQAPAYYEQGTPNGSRPGTVFVNTYDWQHRSTTEAESIACHEGLPGHHLQISIAQQLTGLPTFRKYLHYTAYTEGWGLYAEQLCQDAGLYQDDYSEFGRLEADEFRAIRLVVDTGVHADHWTRQQMVDFFHQHSGLDDATINAEVDRYIAWPAQALGYKIGELKMMQLRDHAKQELGTQFDLRTFDDQLVDSGAMPLDVLAQQIDRWIAGQKDSESQKH